MEGGRRIVMHEFPKKDIGYPEDMGRRARRFSVRGYIINLPRRDVRAAVLDRLSDGTECADCAA